MSTRGGGEGGKNWVKFVPRSYWMTPLSSRLRKKLEAAQLKMSFFVCSTPTCHWLEVTGGTHEHFKCTISCQATTLPSKQTYGVTKNVCFASLLFHMFYENWNKICTKTFGCIKFCKGLSNEKLESSIFIYPVQISKVAQYLKFSSTPD